MHYRHDHVTAVALAAALDGDDDRMLRTAAYLVEDPGLLAAVFYRMVTLVRPCGVGMSRGDAVEVMYEAATALHGPVAWPDGLPFSTLAEFVSKSLSWATLQRYEPTAVGRLLGASAEAPPGHYGALLATAAHCLAALIRANPDADADDVLELVGGDPGLFDGSGEDDEELLQDAAAEHLAGLTAAQLAEMTAPDGDADDRDQD